MTTERVSGLPRAAADVLSDFADLVVKETRLAKAELSAKLSTKLRAGIWMSTAAGLGLVAVILLAQALVFWIAAAFTLPVHLSCLIVAVGFAAIAALAFYQGREDAREDLTLTRTMHQIEQDINTTKEKLR
jgi:Putative Actinobacterial Holin-X, holin superfamily III